MIDKQIQRESEKIWIELDTRCIIIYGKPRNWKTILAASIWYETYKKRLYTNFNVYYRGESINKRFKTYQEVENIRFSYTHGCIIVDESWLNLNSKDSFSEANRIMQKILFLSWKKNCDMIMIAQSYQSVDVNFRRNAAAMFEVVKIKREWKKPLFVVNRVIVEGEKVRVIASYTLDTLTIMENWKISYDTLDESKMKNENKERKIQEKKDKEEMKKMKADGLI